MTVINLIGIGIIVVFLFFILSKSGKRTADHLLILFNLLLINYLLADVLIRMEFTVASFFFHLVILFYTPCFVLYALVLMDPDHKLRRRWWWLVFPAMLYAVIVSVDFAIHQFDVSFVESLYTQPAIWYQILYKGQILFAIFLLFWLLRQIRIYQRNIKENYSYIENLHLNWIRVFAWINIAQNGLIIAIFVLFSVGWLRSVDAPFLIINAVMVLSVFYLSFYGIRQYNLAEFDVLLRSDGNKFRYVSGNEDEDMAEADKYSSSSLAESEMDDILERTVSLFENEQMFLEPQLKIGEIAAALNISIHKLSQTINSRTGQSFYDFVNGYRIAYFKNLLSDPANRKYTILALGFDSGFNSKATLNRIFKREEGISPSEYKKKLASN